MIIVLIGALETTAILLFKSDRNMTCYLSFSCGTLKIIFNISFRSSKQINRILLNKCLVTDLKLMSWLSY